MWSDEVWTETLRLIADEIYLTMYAIYYKTSIAANAVKSDCNTVLKKTNVADELTGNKLQFQETC